MVPRARWWDLQLVGRVIGVIVALSLLGAAALVSWGLLVRAWKWAVVQ